MNTGEADAFYRGRAAPVDANGLGRAMRHFLDRTGCAVEAGKALVQTFTVDLDVPAGLVPRAPADLRPRSTLRRGG